MAEKSAAPAAPILRLVGRIENVRRTSVQQGTVFVHLVRLRAPDEYSSPATVRVSASERCGDVGAQFDQLVQVGGYARSYDTTDDETGRKVRVPTADNTLTVVG